MKKQTSTQPTTPTTPTTPTNESKKPFRVKSGLRAGFSGGDIEADITILPS